ncbi:hypothetical protein HYDPIDRAFT_70430, partial [Hydnomerulius pinastri MD-312]
ISQCPWATPTARLAMDTHFKMCRAAEEITRLNVELRHFSTYLYNEDKYLLECEAQLHAVHPPLARQVACLRGVHRRFHNHHLERLHQVAKLPGFSGTLSRGESVKTAPGESASIPRARVPTSLVSMVQGAPLSGADFDDAEGNAEEEEGDDGAEEIEEEIL